MIRILIVDDHAILRAGLKHLLSESVDIVVAGEAGNGVDALATVGLASRVRCGRF